MNTRRNKETAIARRNPALSWHGRILGFSLLFVVLVWAGIAAAQGTTVSHGFKRFGTLKYGPDMARLDYVNPDAPKGGEIAVWTQGTFDSFNPYAKKGTSAWGASIGIERLMSGTADEIGSKYCLICTSLEYPEDHSWVIFKLRDDVKFSDGTPLTAEDVAFTHNLLMEQALPSFREGVKRIISGVEVIDPLTVKFTFVPDSPKFDRIDQAGATPVMSKAWFEKTGQRLDETSEIPIMGTGPYVYDSSVVNERIIYKRNPDYWGANHPLNVGHNNFDTIRVEYFADSNAAFEGFKAGAYTFRIENSSKQWATGYDFPALEKGWVVKAELPDGNMASGQAFVINLRRDRFQDPRVREAIGLMFNFEWSNESLFFGLYERIHSFVENSYLEPEGPPSPEELAVLEPISDLLPPGVLDSEPVMAPTSRADQAFDRANARKAMALLDEAGWVVGDDGMRRNAAGETLKVEFLQRSPAFDRIVNPYVDNLRKIGVDAKLDRVDNAQWVDRRYAFDYDMVNDSLALGYEPGSNLAQMFGSEDADDSVFNSPGLKDPAVDALIEVIRRAETKEELDPAVSALDRVLRAIRFWVPQWYKDVYTVAYFDMFEHPENLPPYSLGYLDFWWVNQDKAEALKAAGALR